MSPSSSVYAVPGWRWVGSRSYQPRYRSSWDWDVQRWTACPCWMETGRDERAVRSCCRGNIPVHSAPMVKRVIARGLSWLLGVPPLRIQVVCGRNKVSQDTIGSTPARLRLNDCRGTRLGIGISGSEAGVTGHDHICRAVSKKTDVRWNRVDVEEGGGGIMQFEEAKRVQPKWPATTDQWMDENLT